MPSNAELRPCPNPGCADSDDLIPFGNMRVTCNNCHLDTTRDVWQALPRPGEEREAVVAWLEERFAVWLEAASSDARDGVDPSVAMARAEECRLLTKTFKRGEHIKPKEASHES